jgi:hypothetical protein
MKICPIAIAVTCEKCPAFKLCPLKEMLGDYGKEQKPSDNEKQVKRPRK